MTSKRARRFRTSLGLLLTALGVAVGLVAYLIGRADAGEASQPTIPQARVSSEATAGASMIVPGGLPS